MGLAVCEISNDRHVLIILSSIQIIAVLGVVFAVLIYRLAVSSFFYQTISRLGLPGGPSVADLTVSITGAVIQLVAITVMNLVYERLALWLTKWGKIILHTHLLTSFSFSQSFTELQLSLKTRSLSRCK